MNSIKETIKAEIERLKEDIPCHYHPYACASVREAYDNLLAFIDSLPEEKLSEDFPTSDEEVAKFLATHPKVEVPEKYKTPNWLFDKQPSDNLEEAANEFANQDCVTFASRKKGFIAGAEWMRKKNVE